MSLLENMLRKCMRDSFDRQLLYGERLLPKLTWPYLVLCDLASRKVNHMFMFQGHRKISDITELVIAM